MTFYNGYVMIGKQEQEDEMAFFKKKGTQTGENLNFAEKEKDYEHMLIKHRRRMVVLAIFLVIVAMAAVVCVKIFLDKRVYENYEVTKTIKMGEVEKCKFYAYGDGVLRYSNDGVSYMIGDETVWNQAFEMKQPVVDMCADYMAIADLEGTTVYIYDKNGQQGEIKTEYPILDIEVAGQGVVAAITKSDIANQIEVYDKDGTNIAKGQTVLSGDGCPVAISLSEDGTKLAVSYVYLEHGAAKTRVVFYNYSEVGKNEAGRIVGGFDYESSIISRVEFVTNDMVAAIGDDIVTFYSMEEKPSKANEIKINQEIQSICYNEKYIGFVFKSESIMNQYILNVYNLNGKKVLDKTMDFQYSDLQMKDNLLIFNNTQQMYIISVDGILKYNGTIQEGIQKVIPGKLENRYLIITNQEAEEIKLK